jgi:hypothetical protein
MALPTKNGQKSWPSSQLGVFMVYYTEQTVVEASLSCQQKGSRDGMHGQFLLVYKMLTSEPKTGKISRK